MVKLKKNDIVSIRNFILTADNSVHLNVEVMNIVDVNPLFNVGHIQKIKTAEKMKIVPIQEIVSKLLRVEVKGNIYVATLRDNFDVS